VRLYDKDLKLIAKKEVPGGKDPFGVAFSPDGGEIAVGFFESTAVNLLSGRDLGFLHAPETGGVDNGNFYTVAWSRDGRTLYAGGRYNMHGDDNGLVSWSDAGRGPARERAISKSTIMELIPLEGGLPPLMEALGETEIRQRGAECEARFRVRARSGGLGRIEWKVNGTEVGRMDGREWFGIGMPGQREERRPFILNPGRNVIEARAFDRDNQVASPPVRYVVEREAGEQRRAALYGLAVGISIYSSADLNLKYGAADAEAFAKALKAQEGRLFRSVEVTPLVNEQATLEGITAAFEALAAKAGPEDVFVLFLAGHGLAMEGRFHFIPWELKYRNRRALTEESLHEARLRELLSKVRAEKSLIVLDACHSGAFMQELQLAKLFTRGRALEESSAIDRLMQTTGRTVLASAAERRFALEGLERRADILGNNNDRVETSELAEYLDAEVPRITRKRWGYAQQPMWELHGQSFPIGLVR